MRSTISVTGTGKVTAAPDIAELFVGVFTHAKTAPDAVSANSKAMAALHIMLEEWCIARKDVRTMHLLVAPRFSEQRETREGSRTAHFTPKLIGYDVTNEIRITCREVSRVGGLLQALVEVGANQVRRVGFRFGNLEDLLEEARKRAMADARRKAEVLAGVAGVGAGSPLRIAEGGGFEPRLFPSPFAPSMEYLPSVSAGPPPPIEPGEEDVSVTVRVIYELERTRSG
jgi:uncharacterized protein YggE